MFEFVELSGTPEKGIEVQTRLGNSIENSQAPHPSEKNIKLFKKLIEEHKKWICRKPPCGFYNCFGHVWANRRTAIYDQDQIELIINDDGYDRLKNISDLKVGDLVIYYNSDKTDIWHVGIVIELKTIQMNQGFSLVTSNENNIPWVLSKWNDSTGEVIHHFQDVPWSDGDYEITFWTERPIGK